MSLPADIIHNYGGVRRPALLESSSGCLEDLNSVFVTQLIAASSTCPRTLLTGIKVAGAATNAGAAAAGVAVGEVFRGPDADPQILYIRRV